MGASMLATLHATGLEACGFDDIEFARDGYADDKTIGILFKDVDSARDGVPEDTDTDLPDAARGVLRSLQPRAR